MRIQEVEKQVGITRKNIRFYEEEGLVNPIRNLENGYRDYSSKDVERLRRVKLLRKLDVPIEEIRNLLEGQSALSLCMQERIRLLDKEREDLLQKQEMCQWLSRQGQSLPELSMDLCEKEMEQMEKKGVRFMDVKTMDKRRQKRAPWLSAAVMVLCMGVIIWLFVWAAKTDPIPLGLLLFLVALPIAVVVGVIVALRQRMKEIEKGEEDAASKY